MLNKKINCVLYKEGNFFIIQGINKDLVEQGKTLEEVKKRFKLTIIANVLNQNWNYIPEAPNKVLNIKGEFISYFVLNTGKVIEVDVIPVVLTSNYLN